MNIQEIIALTSKMFPNNDIAGALNKAREMLPANLPNNLQDAQKVAKQIGLDSNMARSIYEKYGKSVQARTLCSMLGTTPEALKEDAEKLLGGQEQASAEKRFPRLK